MKAFLTTALLLYALGCTPLPSITASRQGVAGEVFWMEGDFMPRIGETAPGIRTPIVREILVYPAINSRDLKNQTGPFYKDLPIRLVDSIISDENGKFEIELPAGTYSVFTREADGLFANSFDGRGIINPVEVKAGVFSEIVIEINYKAVF